MTWSVLPPAYLRRCGSPRTPDDLGSHVCIGYAHAPVADEWRFTDDVGNVQAVKIKSAIQTNSCDMARAAALAGVGIIWQPLFDGRGYGVCRVGKDNRSRICHRQFASYQDELDDQCTHHRERGEVVQKCECG